MILLRILLGVLMFVPQGQKSKGVEILDNALKNFSGIKDYTVDVTIHADSPELRVPDMQATVYFKAPDKVKLDSKGSFFMMPREVGAFNPSRFNPDDFYVGAPVDTTIDSLPAVTITLRSKKEDSPDRTVTLTIDTKEWLIRRVASERNPGREFSFDISYDTFDGYHLPVSVLFKLDIDQSNTPPNSFDGERRSKGGIKGTIEIHYSNYKINSGLSDKIFRSED